MVEKNFNGLPGIDEYLSARGNGQPIDISELKHITDAIMAFSNLSEEQSQRILTLFFQEIRSAMLKGEIVDIRGLGTFLISSPHTTNTKKRVFPKFIPKFSLIKRLNAR